MGTRKSKHNRGRKPFYKEHRLVAHTLLENPFWPKGHLFSDLKEFNSNYTWSDLDLFKLDILAEADAPLDGAADVFARRPTAVADRARKAGIFLPPEWAASIRPKYVPRPRKPKEPTLTYPYILKPRPEHADLLAINAVIPKGLPDHMRADICQEVMVAILEGRTTLADLEAKRATATYYIKKFWRENYEDAGRAISFRDTDDDWDEDRVASSIAAKEWHRERFAERTSAADAYRTFTPPVQFEAAWQDQVGQIQMKLADLGCFLDRDEIEQLYGNAE